MERGREPAYIGVIGDGTCPPDTWALAEEIGRLLAERKAVLVCGGRGGVMEAASRGAAEGGGIAVGILPGESRREGNRYLTVAIPTGLGPARNALVVRACDAVIAVSGGYGTLSEIGLALKMGIPVVGLRTWSVSKNGVPMAGIVMATDPADAVTKAFALAADYRRAAARR